MDKNIGIIGGDLRISKLAKLFAEDGYKIYTYAIEETQFEEKVQKCERIEEVINCSNIIISGVPFSKDGKTIYAPLSKEIIYIDELLGKLEGKTLIAGSIKSDIIKNSNIEIVDILKEEELTVLNAIPTAEGAIEIAIRESEITLHSSNCLILGYGRIGKILAKMLDGIGAKVFCEARKKEDLALVESYGYNSVNLENLNDDLGKYDFIFNTIPYIILKEEEQLAKIKRECIIIDLASSPGGIDFDLAKKNNIKAILALRTSWKNCTTDFGKIHKRDNNYINICEKNIFRKRRIYMLITQSIILGIVQGITELLPISSSAHLFLIPWFFNWSEIPGSFDVALHFGTLLAIGIFFFKDWINLIKGAYKSVKKEKNFEGKMFWYIVIATIPGAGIGFVLDKYAEELLTKPAIIGVALIVMGLLLYFVDKKMEAKTDYKNLTMKQTFLIGLSQALAFIPGVSRSGVTMTVGRLLKVDRESTAKFSFMLSAPIVLGATLYKFKDFAFNLPFVIGVITSFVVGIVVIKFLLEYLKKGSFKLFAIYRVIVGAIILGILFLK